jgi:hypothetical protein
MFGKNNDDQQDDLNIPAEQVDQLAGSESTATSPADETVSIPPVPDSITSDPTPPAPDQAAGDDWQHPGTPLNDDASTPTTDDGAASTEESAAPTAPAPINDVISPYSDQAAAQPAQPASSLPPIAIPSLTSSTPPASSSDTAATDTAPAATGDSTDSGDLADIKQKALGELSPLIDELDQPPEEKFRTVMMMIQASDDQSMVAKAYEIAHSIEDEKARAQALLDIVNEINYFTQHPQS